MVCAKTGVPTTLLRKHYLFRMHRVVWWSWIVWNPVLVLIYKACNGGGTHIVLPVSREVRRRQRLARTARALGLGVVIGLLSTTQKWASPRGLVLVGAIVGWLWLHRTTRRGWVAPRWTGSVVTLRQPHWDFAAALQPSMPGYVMPQVEAFRMPQVESFAPPPPPPPPPVAPEPFGYFG
jgi:hypothetical protein